MILTTDFRFWCLLVVLPILSSGWHPAAAAQATRTQQMPDLDPVVVTATRLESPRHDVAANVTVVTREQLDSLPAVTIAEALQYIPGVYIEFNGGPGSFAQARIQGAETRHVAVYRDDVPLNQLANPITDLSGLTLNNVERIEIYKGAASSAWGSALGGVINIITRRADPRQPASGDIKASYGEFQTLKSNATLSGGVNDLEYLLTLTHDESDGFVPHTEFERNSAYAKLGLSAGPNANLDLVLSFDKGDTADPALDFTGFWDDIHQERIYQRLLLELTPSDQITLALEGRHHQFDIRVEDVFADHREIFNDYEDETWGTSAHLDWRSDVGNTLLLGFDGNWGSYDWINYADTYDTGNWALYLQDTFVHGPWSLSAGVRHDHNDDFGDEISPSAGAVYRFQKAGALLRAQIAKGFSAPPAAWVHDPQWGNPGLQPETAMNVQLGAEFRPWPFMHFEINLFRAQIDDLIRFDFDSLTFQNIDAATRQGLEGSLLVSLPVGLSLNLGGSYVDVRDDQTDEIIADIPRSQYHLSLVYTHPRTLQTLVGRYIDHNSSFTETKDQVFVFDYKFKFFLPWPSNNARASIFGAVYNLLDTAYLYRHAWPQPGRWAEAGLQFSF